MNNEINITRNFKLNIERLHLLIKNPFYQKLSSNRKILSKVEFLNCPHNEILYLKYYTIF